MVPHEEVDVTRSSEVHALAPRRANEFMSRSLRKKTHQQSRVRPREKKKQKKTRKASVHVFVTRTGDAASVRSFLSSSDGPGHVELGWPRC